MVRRWRMLVGAGLCGALLAGACSGGQSGGEVTTNEPEPPNSGPSECEVDTDCRERALDALRRITATAELLEPHGGECQAFGVGGDATREAYTALACECHFAQRDVSIGLAEYGPGCFHRGRDGACLFSAEDYSGCDVSDDASCDAPCALFAERWNADATAEVQAEIVSLECDRGNCRSVIALNGACYALSGTLSEEAYDCSLEPDEIFARYEAYLNQINTPPEPRGTPVEIETFFTPGSSGVVTLRQGEVRWSGQLVFSGFSAHARFFEPIEARGPFREEVIDPLEGTDDCGVRSVLSGDQPTPFRQFSVSRAVLVDDGVERELAESHFGLNYTYNLDLAGAGVAPRHGGRYAFAASGGSFGGSVELPEIILPERLSLPLLESQGRLERGPLELTWTGRGNPPLKLALLIQSTLEEFSDAYYSIECLMVDDGAFTIPAAVLEAVPEGLGFATASFKREHRELVQSGERLISSIATVAVTHHFALAPACDNSAVMRACLVSAESIQASYVACGVEPPVLELLCPSYLSESCLACPEYFACAAAAVRCDAQGLSTGSGCACP